jgi:hypothetical protein
MKKTMKTRRMMFGLVAAGCAMAMVLPPRATAQAIETAQASPTTTVSADDFKKLQGAVQQLSEQVQKLEQANTAQQQTHQDDIQQIQQLQNKLDQTQQTAEDAEQKSTAAAQAQAQPQPMPRMPLDEATVNHSFQMLGDAEFQYAKMDQQHGAFIQADFAPIFLYRGGDNILFEAGFDFILQNNGGTPGTLTDTAGNPFLNGDGGGLTSATSNGTGYTTTVNLSFAQLDYVVNDYATLCVGNLVLPLGTYSERSAGWLNKFPDSPLARGLVPGTGVGAEVRGAVSVGNDGKFINYSVYGVNGPGSADGTSNAGQLDIAGGNVGFRSDGVVANLHTNPSGGGRLGLFLPFAKPHTDLELGISAQSGEWDNAGQHLWSAGVLDASLHLGPSIEVKGEYIRSWYGSEDLGEIRTDGYWVQAGYKLAGLNLDLPVINNLELLGRYDSINDGMGNTSQRESAGFAYYVTSALLFEGDYEFLNSNSPDPSQPTNNIIFQLSYGF